MSEHKLPSSRKDARTTNSNHYFTGNPCKWGHISKRLTDSGGCTQCREDYLKSDKYLIYAKSDKRKAGKKSIIHPN